MLEEILEVVVYFDMVLDGDLVMNETNRTW